MLLQKPERNFLKSCMLLSVIFAAHGHTAVELIYDILNADKPFIGLSNYYLVKAAQSSKMKK